MSILNNSIVPASAACTDSAGGYEIDNSLRFNDDDSAYLSWTPISAAGNRRTWTWSGWVKRGNLGTTSSVFRAFGAGEYNTTIRFSGDTIDLHQVTGSFDFHLTTEMKLRDTSDWYHIIIVVDTTQTTATNRLKIYVNGEQCTSFGTETYPSQNKETYICNNNSHVIGADNLVGQRYDGYMSEVHFIDGQALDPSSFGESDSAYGHWKPIEYTGTYGTNGFYLNFKGDDSLISATGGTITTDGDYKVHTFNSSGTFEVTNATGIGVVEYLVIGGGGGGGHSDGGNLRGAGGGGAGGYRTASGFLVSPQSYAITVGAGGIGGSGEPDNGATKGSDSVFSSITSTGGGRGLDHPNAGTTGKDGGSGGGGSWLVTAGGLGNTPATSPSQGNNGGAGGDSHPSHGGGGGGGASSVGANRSGGTGGAGGAGLASSITGTSITRAGGGGGGGSSTGGAGGAGGGGAGQSGTSNSSTSGTANTGGGGGGAADGADAGGDGGSGVVIIRYKYK